MSTPTSMPLTRWFYGQTGVFHEVIGDNLLNCQIAFPDKKSGGDSLHFPYVMGSNWQTWVINFLLDGR